MLLLLLLIGRMLGEVGCSYGCSMILCHLHMLRSKKLVLNVANAGMSSRAMKPFTMTLHSCRIG